MAAADPPAASSGPPGDDDITDVKDAAAPSWRSSRELLRAVKPCSLERSGASLLAEVAAISETWPRLLPILLSDVLVGGSNVPHLKHGLPLSKGVELIQRARHSADSEENPPALAPAQLVALVNSVSWAQEKAEAKWAAFQRLQDRLSGRGAGDARIRALELGAQGIRSFRGDPRKPSKDQDLEILRGLSVELWFDEASATRADLTAARKLKRCTIEPYPFGVFEEPLKLGLADFELLLLEGCWEAAGLKDKTKAWVARKFLEYWEAACVSGPDFDFNLIHKYQKLWVESPPPEGRVAQRLSPRAATSLLLGPEALFPLSFRLRFLEEWVDLDGDCTELASRWLAGALAGLIPEPSAIAREGPARSLLNLVSKHQGLVAALLDLGACKGGARSTPEAHGLVASLLLRRDINFTTFTPLQATTCQKIIACLAGALKSKGASSLSAVERETLSSFLRSSQLLSLKFSTNMLFQSQDALFELYVGLLHCHTEAPNEGAKIELTKRLLMLYAEGDETWCSARAMAPTADQEAVARGRRRPEELRHPLPRLLERLLGARVPSPYLSLGNFSANCAMLIQKKFFHSWLPPTFRVRLYEWSMEQVDLLFSLTGAVAEVSSIDLGGLSQFFSSVALPAFRVEHVLQLWRRLTLSVDSWSFVQVSLAAIQKDSRFESSFRLARNEIEKRVAALAVPRHDQLRLDPRLTPELLGREAPVQDESASRCEGLQDALRTTHEVYDVLSEVLERLDSSAHGYPRADWVRAKQTALCPWRFRAENGPWAMRQQGENSERPAERPVTCCQGKAIPSGLLPTDQDLDLGGEAEASRGPVTVPELPMAVINDSLNVTRAFYLAAIFHEKHSQMERLKTKDDFELLKHWLDNLDWEPVLRSSWVPSFGTARKKAAPGQQASTGGTDILLRFVDLLSLRWADPKEAMHRCTLFWDRVSSAHNAISMADVEPADGRRYELLRLVDWHEELRRNFLLSQNLAWRSPSGWDELRSWVAYAQSLGSDAGGLWGPRRSGGGASGGAAPPCGGSRADALGLLLIFAKRCPHLSGAMVPQAPGQAALPGQQPAAAAVVHSSKSFVLERCQARQLRVTSRWDQRASRIDLRRSAEEEERLGLHAASRWEASGLEANLRLLTEHCSSVEELARVLGRGSLAAAKVLDLDGEERLHGLRRELELTVPLSFGDDEEPRAASLTTEVKRLQKSIAGAERELQKMRFRRGGVAVAELLDFLVAGERLVLEECVRRQRQKNTKLLWRLWWWSLRSSSCSLGACARRPIVAEEAARREREVLIRLGMLVEEERMTFRSILRRCCGCFGMMHRRLRLAANEAFLRGLRQKPLGTQVQIVKELYPLEASAAAEGAGPEEKLSRGDADRILREFAADPTQATVSKVLELIRATAGAGDVGAAAGVRRHEAFLRALIPALAQGWSIQQPRPDGAPPARRRRFRAVLAGLAELLGGSSELQALGREEELLELWRRCGAALWASLDAEPDGLEPPGGGAAAGDEGSLAALASFIGGESPESNFESWGERGLEDRAEPLAGLPPRFWGLLDFAQLATEATALRLLAAGHEPLRPTRGLRRSVFCGFSARAQSELLAGLLARCRGAGGGGGLRRGGCGDALLLLAEFVPLLSGPVLRELRQLFSILQKLVLDPAEERPDDEEEDVLSTLATEGLESHERRASGWSRVMQVLLRGLRDRAQGLHLESLASPSEKVTVGDLQELYTGDWARRFEFLLPLHDLAAVSPNWLHTKEQEIVFRFCLTSVQRVPAEGGPDEGAGSPGGRYKESPLLNSTNCQYLCNLLEGKAVDPNHVSSLVSSILCDEEFESVGGPAVSLVKETALRAMMRLGNDEKKAVVRELMAPIVEAMAAQGSGGKGFVRLSPYTLFALSVVDIGGLDRGWLDALAWYVDRLIRLSEEEVRREKEGDGKPATKYATIRLEKLENLIRDANPLKVNQVHTFPRSLKIQKLLCPRFLGRFQEDAAKGDHRFFRLFIATSAPRDVPVVLLGLLDRQLLGNNPAAEQLIFDAISSARVRTCTTTVQFRGFLEHIPDSQMPTRMEWVSRMVAPRSSVESGPEPPLSRVSSLGSEGFELVIVTDDGVVTAAIDEPLPSSPELPAGSSGSAQMMLREFLAHLLERRHRGSLGLLTFSLNNAVDSVGSLLKMYSSMSRAKTEELAATAEMLAAVKAFVLELNAVALASAEPGADRSPVAMPQRLRSLWISFLKLRWSHAPESDALCPDELEEELLECLPTAFAGCEGRGLRFEPLALQEIQGFAEVPGSPSAIRQMLTREGTPLGASARQSALACFGQAIIEDLIPVEALALGADDPPPSLTKFLRSLNEKEFQSVSMGKDRHLARVIVKSLICIVSDQASASQSGSYLTPAHVLSYACRAICKPLSSTSLGTSFVDDAEVEEAAVLLKQIYALCDSFTRRQMRLQALVGDMMWSRKGEWMQSQILDQN